MTEAKLTPEQLVQIDYSPPNRPWMDSKPEFRKGVFCHGANPQTYKYLSLPGARKWQPSDQDWQLPVRIRTDNKIYKAVCFEHFLLQPFRHTT